MNGLVVAWFVCWRVVMVIEVAGSGWTGFDYRPVYYYAFCYFLSRQWWLSPFLLATL